MPIEGQVPELKELSDSLNREAFGETIQEANDAGRCISCKLQAIERCYSEAGRKEFYISGMCERCFDDAFEEEE
jgi:hypothetical protein